MNKGFTLIELLVVVLIIGILSAVALPQYTTAVEKARAAEALTLMSSMRYAAERYRLQKNKWPGDWDALDVEMPSSGGTYGGKNFSLALSCTTAAGCTGDTLVITAKRTAGATYALKTIVNKNGTATRCCTSSTDTSTTCSAPTEEKAEKYCYAIASGAPTNF